MFGVRIRSKNCFHQTTLSDPPSSVFHVFFQYKKERVVESTYNERVDDVFLLQPQIHVLLLLRLYSMLHGIFCPPQQRPRFREGRERIVVAHRRVFRHKAVANTGC